MKKEMANQPHEGETPPQIIREVLEFSDKAVAAIDAAAPLVSKDQEEFGRLRNDVHCIRAMSRNYAAKANAALCVLRYGFTKDLADMEKAESFLAESLEHFRELTRLTEGAYHFANSMQTSQRRIPVPGGVDGKPANYHWTQLLPLYEQELADFREKVSAVKRQPATSPGGGALSALENASFTLLAQAAETYAVDISAKAFSDRDLAIESVAPELKGLKGIRVAFDGSTPIEFDVPEPVQILIGYFNSDDKQFRKPPNLETDALAGEHGGTEAVLRNAVKIQSLPPLDVHVMTYAKGRHKLDPRGQGAFVVVGVIPHSTKLAPRDAEIGK
jgi:hypothetical protein